MADVEAGIGVVAGSGKRRGLVEAYEFIVFDHQPSRGFLLKMNVFLIVSHLVMGALVLNALATSTASNDACGDVDFLPWTTVELLLMYVHILTEVVVGMDIVNFFKRNVNTKVLLGFLTLWMMSGMVCFAIAHIQWWTHTCMPDNGWVVLMDAILIVVVCVVLMPLVRIKVGYSLQKAMKGEI